jgi:hypothetical protein
MNATKEELLSAALGLPDDDRLDFIVALVASLRTGVGRGTNSAADQNGSPAIGSEAWGQMNQRRAELIRKKNRQGLTPEEQGEYERLQSRSRAALQAAFPSPSADDERLDKLEARLRAGTKE